MPANLADMSLAQPRLTAEEYLARERAADHKSEFYRGEVFAMAGASEAHNLIVANLLRELGTQFKGRPCKVFPSDMRVKVSRTGLYTYPDVSALCGPATYEEGGRDTLLNPSLVVEVLSDSTESYDRGAKFAHYRSVDTITDYLLIAQDRPLVEHYSRQADGRWLLGDFRSLQEVVLLPGLECRLPLAEIYDKLEFPEEEAPPGPARSSAR